MKNTLENKSKFFAQYWGQNVMINGSSKFEVGYLDEPREKDYLELKCISSITDEDLLKIAELLSWRKSMQESSIIAQTKELLLQQSQTNLYREHWSDIVDKVRELGYAHKWNGISVEEQIEFGWIKIK
jgi:hypothetical protein